MGSSIPFRLGAAWLPSRHCLPPLLNKCTSYWWHFPAAGGGAVRMQQAPDLAALRRAVRLLHWRWRGRGQGPPDQRRDFGQLCTRPPQVGVGLHLHRWGKGHALKGWIEGAGRCENELRMALTALSTNLPTGGSHQQQPGVRCALHLSCNLPSHSVPAPVPVLPCIRPVCRRSARPAGPGLAH